SARVLNLLYRTNVRTRRGLIGWIYFQALFFSGLYDRIVKEVPSPEIIKSYFVNFAVGVAHLYKFHSDQACYFLERAIYLTIDRSYEAQRKLGCAYLLKADYDRAAERFKNLFIFFLSLF